MRAEPPARGTAVVTGGARGIGEAIAVRVVAAGGRVVLADLDEERGRAVAERLGTSAQFVHTDVTDETAIEELFEVAQRQGPPVDAVFANAGGVGTTGPLAETPLRDYRRTVDLLLTSAFLTMRAGIRAMAPLGRGALVATGSVAGIRAGLGPHVYTAAKHAVHGLVLSIATEVAPLGLRANVVAPGATVSGLSAGLFGDPDDTARAHERLGASSAAGVPTTSDDIARTAMFLAYDADRVNGAALVIDGGDAVLGSSGRAFHSARPRREGEPT